MPDPILITVTALPAGFTGANITVAPTLANFHPGDVVKWSLTNANGTNLSISFKNGVWPFAPPPSTLAGGPAIEQGIPPGAAPGSYHYTVTATVGGVNYLIPGCPEIVVQ